MKILIVEDDPEISLAVREGLEDLHYEVDVVRDGERALRVALSRTYALIILDLMLPGLDGISICTRLRAQHVNTPVLMLTAKGGSSDKVAGLNCGADDYLAKPFDFDELIARVRALMRRDKVNKAAKIHVYDLTVDTVARVVVRGDKQVFLTPREYSLLEALASRQGQVLTREVIQGLVWGDESSSSNTVDVHIRNLRRKVDDGFPEPLIRTVFGAGYTMKSPGDPSAKHD
jgi:DNA-binding response OmpR family regulator